jgi:hypothetical protein
MKRYPFVCVQAYSAAITAPVTYTNALGLPMEFHIVSFMAEIDGTSFVNQFQWNFKIHGSQKYFFYQDLAVLMWANTVGYLPYKLPEPIVIPPNSILDFLFTPINSSNNAGQLILIGYLQ